jgi:hypothetical protein
MVAAKVAHQASIPRGQYRPHPARREIGIAETGLVGGGKYPPDAPSSVPFGSDQRKAIPMAVEIAMNTTPVL